MTDDQILTRILEHEGGFVHLKDDRGGPTNFGITQRTLSEWLGRPATVDDVRSMSVETAKAIYRARYLAPFEGLGLDPTLKAQVVDIAVNSGVTTARALLGVAQAQSVRPVQVQLVIERLKHYARIVKARPTQSIFLPGWTNRAVSFLTLALVLSLPVQAQDGFELPSGDPASSWGFSVPTPVGR